VVKRQDPEAPPGVGEGGVPQVLVGGHWFTLLLTRAGMVFVARAR
jgi:hypothetical protein